MLKWFKFNEILRNSESRFQVHVSSTKAMFQYMRFPPFKVFRPVEKDQHPVGGIQRIS